MSSHDHALRPSDDPVHNPDGCVHIDDARRLATGRTLVNLDAVDFAPILAALKRAAESARRLAEWEADGWIGSAGHELLSQLAKRWTAFASALVSAGMTENAAWTYDLEKATAEQLNAAWTVLRDLLLDMRKGKNGPEGKFDRATLAKRLTVAVELVQALTPTGAAPGAQTVVEDDSAYRPAKGSKGPRITCDRDTRAVDLDGRRIPVKHAQTFRVLAALIEAHNAGRTPISGRALFDAAGLKGNKDPRPERLWPNLPEELSSIIQSEAAPNGGYSLILPAIEN
jgi:hypothetical protein